MSTVPTIPIQSGPCKTFRPLNPYETFIEYEGSTITIPLTVVRKDKNGVEVSSQTEPIVLRAFMRLEVLPAYINGLGTREFQFIIRDWDLFGTNHLLNEFVYGRNNPRGALILPAPKGNQPRRQQAFMTFTVAHHYRKIGDDDNQNLATAEHLVIDNVTSHDLTDGHIFWQIDSTPKGLRILFHNKSAGSRAQAASLNVNEHPADLDHLLGVAETLGDSENFTATRTPEEYGRENLAFSKGNTVVSDLIKLRTPVSIRWKLGKNPKPGANGAIQIISPPRSICTAHQRPEPGYPFDSADFPARIMYAASYHVHINQVRFVQDQAGIAICDGVHEIPPRDVTVAFDKPFSGGLRNDIYQILKYGPGCCIGMHEIAEEEYRRGVEFARHCRTLPLQPSV